MANGSTWSPLTKINDKIQGKVDSSGKLFCACGNEPREFTVRKEGPTKGKVFYKCATDTCQLFVWQEHVQYFDAWGRRTSQPNYTSTQAAAAPSQPAPSPSPAPMRSQAGVKGRSKPTSTPSKRKATPAKTVQEDNSATEDEDESGGFFGSPTKRNRSAQPPQHAARPRQSTRPVTADEEEEDEITADHPSSPSLTPHKNLASFGTAAPKTPSHTKPPSGTGTTPLTGAMDALKLSIEESLNTFEKECTRQNRLMNASTQKAEAKDRLLANAHKEIAQLKSRIKILEDENAALKSSQ